MPFLHISLQLNTFLPYQCNTPTFVGGDSVCGLDSDNDGFPDVGLDCDEPSCEAVR